MVAWKTFRWLAHAEYLDLKKLNPIISNNPIVFVQRKHTKVSRQPSTMGNCGIQSNHLPSRTKPVMNNAQISCCKSPGVNIYIYTVIYIYIIIYIHIYIILSVTSNIHFGKISSHESHSWRCFPVTCRILRGAQTTKAFSEARHGFCC